jgi:hypothetical protein
VFNCVCLAGIRIRILLSNTPCYFRPVLRNHIILIVRPDIYAFLFTWGLEYFIQLKQILSLISSCSCYHCTLFYFLIYLNGHLIALSVCLATPPLKIVMEGVNTRRRRESRLQQYCQNEVERLIACSF